MRTHTPSQRDLDWAAHGRPVRAMAILALAWIVVGLAPRIAVASCGYVVVIENPSQEAHQQMASMATEHLSTPLPAPNRPAVPCDGPQCRGGKGPIMPLAGSVVMTDLAAIEMESSPVPPSPSNRLGSSDTPVLTEDHSLMPESPPRG